MRFDHFYFLFTLSFIYTHFVPPPFLKCDKIYFVHLNILGYPSSPGEQLVYQGLHFQKNCVSSQQLTLAKNSTDWGGIVCSNTLLRLRFGLTWSLHRFYSCYHNQGESVRSFLNISDSSLWVRQALVNHSKANCILNRGNPSVTMGLQIPVPKTWEVLVMLA